MAYKLLTSYNGSEGGFIVLQSATDSFPILPAMILLMVYMITLLSSFFSQKRLTGRGNFGGSMAAAGILTFVVSIALSLIPNIISQTYVVISLVIAIIGVVILFVTKEESV